MIAHKLVSERFDWRQEQWKTLSYLSWARGIYWILCSCPHVVGRDAWGQRFMLVSCSAGWGHGESCRFNYWWPNSNYARKLLLIVFTISNKSSRGRLHERSSIPYQLLFCVLSIGLHKFISTSVAITDCLTPKFYSWNSHTTKIGIADARLLSRFIRLLSFQWGIWNFWSFEWSRVLYVLVIAICVRMRCPSIRISHRCTQLALQFGNQYQVFAFRWMSFGFFTRWFLRFWFDCRWIFYPWLLNIRSSSAEIWCFVVSIILCQSYEHFRSTRIEFLTSVSVVRSAWAIRIINKLLSRRRRVIVRIVSSDSIIGGMLVWIFWIRSEWVWSFAWKIVPILSNYGYNLQRTNY